MQVLSAYLFESPELDPQTLVTRAAEVMEAISDWLSKKGAANPLADSGEFESLTQDGQGRFTRKVTAVSTATLTELRLEEATRAGQSFITTISTVITDRKVILYGSLSNQSLRSVIAPPVTDPRCPSVIRSILAMHDDWQLNGGKLSNGQARTHSGSESGQILADEIRSDARSLPIIVISQNEGEVIWEDLPAKLAYDLAGLANVVVIDGDASWRLTDMIGKQDSCYLGAVRIYWPAKRAASGEMQAPSTVWTASALLSSDHDGRGEQRFCGALRRLIMPVAALTLEPPGEIREIQNVSARAQLQELEARAQTISQELELARLFVADNEQLRAERDALKRFNSQLSARAEAAEFALAQQKVEGASEFPASPDEGAAPGSGETRYYKKTHSKGAYDVFVRVSSCGHTSWQSADKADKAKKGLARLEGRDDWALVQHCGSCTGGGMWKVRW